MTNIRHQHEIEHGKLLASSGAESIWGWDSPAGKVRAQRRASMITDHLPHLGSIQALEIGCGTGDFTRLFAASVDHLTAVDISAELLDIAHTNLADLINVDLLLSSFEALPNTTQFDAIIGSSVLHHLEIQPALSHIHRLLKPGGVVSFAEPNMLNPQIMVQKNIRWIKKRMGDSPDETAFFRWQINRYLLNAGFGDIQITPFDWLHPLVPPKMINFVSKTGQFLEKIPLIKEIAGSLLIFARKVE
jgi:ubiquinone/menaquinone biosynthesis C-methylase UbiE